METLTRAETYGLDHAGRRLSAPHMVELLMNRFKPWSELGKLVWSADRFKISRDGRGLNLFLTLSLPAIFIGTTASIMARSGFGIIVGRVLAVAIGVGVCNYFLYNLFRINQRNEVAYAANWDRIFLSCGLCPGCGYAFTGGSVAEFLVCPECGARWKPPVAQSTKS